MTIVENLSQVQQRITDACLAVGRAPSEVHLLPVSKTWPADRVRELAGLGVTMVAENRVQEAKQKAADLADLNLAWSMIGHLQTNKAKDVLAFASELQSLDSLRLATELDRRLAHSGGLRGRGEPLRVYLQVNTSREASKSGVAPDDTVALARQIASLEWLQPVGLMTIAAPSPDPEVVSGCFRQLRDLRDQVRNDDQARSAEGAWSQLSMGMSGDLELAIAEGATVVRVGRAIFGQRPVTPS